MIQIENYSIDEKNTTVERIIDFYGFHVGLLVEEVLVDENDYEEAVRVLKEWTSPPHELYIIKAFQKTVGFIHICFRGDAVVWIEDIYVDQDMRNKGIATGAIGECELILKEQKGAKAVCMDVVTRNKEALQLYHKLGYNNLSLVTVRKEFYENKRNIKEKILGLDFNI